MTTPKRRVFFSFHYELDAWRAGQIRNAGALDGNEPVTDNHWETIRRGGDAAIQRWIDDEIRTRSCTVVLIGSETSEREWVRYEITKSWNDRKGVVGFYIHNLEDHWGQQSRQGKNPFDAVTFNGSGKPLSCAVKAYNPKSNDSRTVYRIITRNLADWVEEAIRIRRQYR